MVKTSQNVCKEHIQTAFSEETKDHPEEFLENPELALTLLTQDPYVHGKPRLVRTKRFSSCARRHGGHSDFQKACDSATGCTRSRISPFTSTLKAVTLDWFSFTEVSNCSYL